MLRVETLNTFSQKSVSCACVTKHMQLFTDYKDCQFNISETASLSHPSFSSFLLCLHHEATFIYKIKNKIILGSGQLDLHCGLQVTG